MLGLYCQVRYLENWNGWFLAASALCFTGAVLLKSNYLIFLVAAVITFLYHALRQKKWRCLVAALVLVITNSLGSFALEVSLEQVTASRLRKGCPQRPGWPWVWRKAPGRRAGTAESTLCSCSRKMAMTPKKQRPWLRKQSRKRMGIFVQEPGYAVEFFAKKDRQHLE